jgi:ATP-dependent Clp protease ATP-binding subunit ClpC
MFERFTDKARTTVVLAQEEARTYGHSYIGTKHILLALLREEEGITARALQSLGISLDAVREQAESDGTGIQETQGHIPFTPEARRHLERSLREALQLGYAWAGPEHILLGLIHDERSVAAIMLARLGADLDVVRGRVLMLLQEEKPQVARLSLAERVSALEARMTEAETEIRRI